MMAALKIYQTSTIVPIAKAEMNMVAVMSSYCSTNRIEVVFYDDRVRVIYGLARTYKVPPKIADMTALIKWLKGRVTVTEKAYKNSCLYKILHQ